MVNSEHATKTIAAADRDEQRDLAARVAALEEYQALVECFLRFDPSGKPLIRVADRWFMIEDLLPAR